MVEGEEVGDFLFLGKAEGGVGLVLVHACVEAIAKDDEGSRAEKTI